MNVRNSRILYFALQRLRREPVADAYRDVRRTEFLSRNELRDLQFRRMRALLLHAAHTVPVYRERLKGIIGQIRRARCFGELKELVDRIPPVEKGSVVGRENDFTSENIKEISVHLNKTSGSTGTPLIFPCDKLSWAYRHAVWYRTLSWFGVEVGEPYGYFFGLHWSKRSQVVVRLRDFVMNRVRVSAYEVSPDRIREYFNALCGYGVTHFVGYPSAIYEFCVLAADQGIRLEALRLKAVFTTAEPLTPSQRELIECLTGARCVDVYGSVEGGINACECPSGSLHAMIETTWFAGTSSTEPPLVTDLFLRAFPLINYAIGDDISFAGEDEFCDCGREHPLIRRVVGRSGEPIRLPNGRVINANLPSYIFKPIARLGVIRRYRFVDEGTGVLRLLLMVTSRFEDSHVQLVRREVVAALGEDIPLAIEIVENMPALANAKHRCYVRISREGSGISKLASSR